MSDPGASGHGAAGGFSFQADVAAYLATTMLAGMVPPWLGLRDGVTLEVVECETPDIVDDIVATASDGGRIFVQAKRRVAASTATESHFGSAMRQLAHQFVAGSRAASEDRELDARDRLVLAVDAARSSRAVYVALHDVLARIRGVPNRPLSEYGRNNVEARVLHLVASHVDGIVADDDVAAFLGLFRPVGLEFGQAGQTTELALHLLALAIPAPLSSETAIWTQMRSLFNDASAGRAGYSRRSLRSHLEDAGVLDPVHEEPSVVEPPLGQQAQPVMFHTRRGSVHLSGRERLVVDHPDFQRLRSVPKHGPLGLVYPGATHSAFAAALERLGLTQSLCLAVQPQFRTVERPELAEEEVALVRLGTLIRELATLPSEDAIEVALGLPGPTHPTRAADILFGASEQDSLAELIDATYADSASFLGDNRGAALIVLDLVGDQPLRVWGRGSSRHGILRELVRGPLAAALNTCQSLENVGTPLAVDVAGIERRLRLVRRGNTGWTVGVSESGLQAIEALAFSEKRWDEIGAGHRVTRAIRAMTERAIIEALDCLEMPGDARAELVRELRRVGDVWSFLDARIASRATNSRTCAAYRHLRAGILHRELHVWVPQALQTSQTSVGATPAVRCLLARQVEHGLDLPPGSVSISRRPSRTRLHALEIPIVRGDTTSYILGETTSPAIVELLHPQDRDEPLRVSVDRNLAELLTSGLLDDLQSELDRLVPTDNWTNSQE